MRIALSYGSFERSAELMDCEPQRCLIILRSTELSMCWCCTMPTNCKSNQQNSQWIMCIVAMETFHNLPNCQCIATIVVSLRVQGGVHCGFRKRTISKRGSSTRPEHVNGMYTYIVCGPYWKHGAMDVNNAGTRKQWVFLCSYCHAHTTKKSTWHALFCGATLQKNPHHLCNDWLVKKKQHEVNVSQPVD